MHTIKCTVSVKTAMSDYCTLLSKVDVPTKHHVTCSCNKRNLGIVVNIRLAAEIRWPIKTGSVE